MPIFLIRRVSQRNEFPRDSKGKFRLRLLYFYRIFQTALESRGQMRGKIGIQIKTENKWIQWFGRLRHDFQSFNSINLKYNDS